MAGKYLRAYILQFNVMREWRLDFIGEYIRVPAEIILLYIVWSIVFSLGGKTVLGGLSLSYFLVYLGLGRFIGSAIPSYDTVEVISEWIKQGNHVNIQTRPIRLIPYLTMRGITHFSIQGISAVLIFTIVASALGWYTPESVVLVLLSVVSLLLGVLVQYYVVLSISMLAFFIIATWGIRNVVENLRSFFSGEFLPLTLFPEWLFNFASFLPFKYSIFVPIFIYLGKYSVQESLKLIGIQVIFIIVFILVAIFLFKKGVRRIDVQGG